jgi:hypothetical protein
VTRVLLVLTSNIDFNIFFLTTLGTSDFSSL